ncbi:MAG: hypothetical protein Q7R96_03375 [Nanoarchaeota archaeon]|nr:hypothetical protein [Nanoarchaeota archaeon]
MNNKGMMPMEYMVGMVIALAVIIATIMIGINVKETGEKTGNAEVCRTAVIEASEIKKISGGETFSLPGISKCEREELLIKKKDVVEKSSTLFTGSATARQILDDAPTFTAEMINQEKASQIIADAMAECWYRYGNGKYDPFSDWEQKKISLCSICKNIRFDEDLRTFMQAHPLQPGGDKDLTIKQKNDQILERYHILSPAEYLMTHQIRPGGPTYFEYLYNQDVKNLKITNEEFEQAKYAIVPENSQILLKMYKLDEKSEFKEGAQYAGAAVGVLAIATGIILAVPTFGASSVLVAAGVSATAVTTAAASLTLGGIAVAAGSATFIGYPTEETFRYCEECQAFGGIYLIPGDEALNIRQQTTFITEKKEEQTTNLKTCDILVN